MHAWQPMHRTIAPGRPARALFGSSGSVISARVIPSASAAPEETMPSASTTSTTREVAMGGGDFDAVEAALRRTPRCLAEAVHDLLDFAAAERAWRHAKALARNRRGRESRSARRPGDLLATAVEQLHEETSAVRLYGLADPSVGVGHLGEVSRQLVRGEDSRWMGCGRLEDDQPGASARPGLVVGDEV